MPRDKAPLGRVQAVDVERRKVKRLVVAGAALAALALAAQAGAAKYQVMLGEQQFCGFQPCKGVIAGIPKGTTLDRFLPAKITIDAGDSITYSSASFHTVSYGPNSPALIIPDPAKGKYAASPTRLGPRSSSRACRS
jgi:plastocyanin